MSFLGKEYKYVSSEKLEDFMKAIGVTGERAQKMLDNDAPQKLVKNADGTYTVHSVNREVTFKSGEEFERDYTVLKAKVTIVVDGNTVTEVQKFDEDRTITIKKVFSDTELIETLHCSSWDGVAKVFFKA